MARIELPPFQTFLDEHRRAVHRFLVAAVGPGEAEDCLQETFLSALRAYPRLRDASNLRGWVLTIATRKAVDAHRRRARRPAPVGDQAALPDRPAADAAAAAAAVEGADPSLWAAVRALPPRQRAAVAHRFVLDLPYREIATAMDCTEEAARANVSAGLRRLREVMRDGRA